MTALYTNKLKYKKWSSWLRLLLKKTGWWKRSIRFLWCYAQLYQCCLCLGFMIPASKKRKVFLNDKRCLCNFIDQYRMPCRHMLATLNYFGGLQEMYEFFGPSYTIESYEKVFEDAVPIEIPLVEELGTGSSVIPPLKIPRKGRPRIGREGIGGESRRCSVCATRGYNRRRRPNVMWNSYMHFHSCIKLFVYLT